MQHCHFMVGVLSIGILPAVTHIADATYLWSRTPGDVRAEDMYAEAMICCPKSSHLDK